jgi:prophage regulatory protein
MQTQLLRLPQVREATGLAKSTIYALIADGEFPKPIKVAGRATAWIAQEVADFIQSRISQSREGE